MSRYATKHSNAHKLSLFSLSLTHTHTHRYGNLDTEADKLDGSGWFCTDPREVGRFGGVWRTSDFDAGNDMIIGWLKLNFIFLLLIGDITLFTMRTVHMSTTNISPKVRISTDIRWQPYSEVADPRYVGDVKVGRLCLVLL